MRRFPSVKNVLFCGFASVVLVLAVPTNPHAKSVHSTDRGAVATMASPVAPTAGQSTNSTTQAQNNNPSAKSNKTNPPKPSPMKPKNGTGQAKQPTTPPGGAAKPNQNKQEPLPQTDLDGNSATSDPPRKGPSSWGYTKAKTAKLRIRVIDGRTRKPLNGAEVVVIENEKRYRTDKQGYTPWFDAPVLRNPRYRPMVQELHGQLGVIVYKNGYRDAVHLGIRMHEDIEQQTTVWMYKLGPDDRRVEPVLYQEPYHHIWLIQLADKFRQKSQVGEGPERP